MGLTDRLAGLFGRRDDSTGGERRRILADRQRIRVSAIDSTTAIGPIRLPGALTGLILAGVDPLTDEPAMS
jgi:hypothetical protein